MENKRQVTLQPLVKEQITVKIRGVSSLLTDPMDMEVVERYDKKKSKQFSEKDTKSEEEKAKNKIYYTEDKKPGIPAAAFAKGMVAVAPYIDGLDMKLVRGSIRVMGNIIPLEFKKMVMNKTYGRSSGITKAPRLIIRPEFKEWSCRLEIIYNKSNISAEQIINLINWAGFQIGVGGFRPEKSGSYGQYEVVPDGK